MATTGAVLVQALREYAARTWTPRTEGRSSDVAPVARTTATTPS
jgi:hypothetical protein